MKRPALSAGLLALVLGVYVFFISPAVSEKRTALREELDDRLSELRKNELLVMDKPAAQAGLEKARKRLDAMEKTMMQVPEEPLAVAKLQGRLQDLAERAGIKILSIKTRPSEGKNGYYALPLEIEGTGGIGHVSDFLKAVDSGGEFVRIDRLSVSTTGLPGEETLRMKVVITGLIKR